MPFFAAHSPSGAVTCGSVIDTRVMYGDRVVMTEVTISPEGVSTSISETTGPSMTSLTLPRNWLRTLMAVMLMVGFSWNEKNEIEGVAVRARVRSDRPAQVARRPGVR